MPQTIDCSPNSRRYGTVCRNHAGNGYQAFANTPISGRPIATETKYAIAHSPLRTTGCARYTVALCAASATSAWMRMNVAPVATSATSRPRRTSQKARPSETTVDAAIAGPSP